MGEDGEPEGGRTRDFPCCGLCFYPKEKSHYSDRELACGEEETLEPNPIVTGLESLLCFGFESFW